MDNADLMLRRPAPDATSADFDLFQAVTNSTAIDAGPLVSPAVAMLFHSVQALRTGSQPFVLQFIAPHPKAGTSFIARQFAYDLAASSRAPALLLTAALDHRAAGRRPSPGLLEAADTGAAFDLPFALGNLFAAHLANRLSPEWIWPSDRVSDLFTRMRARFGAVVVDSSALSDLPQGAMLSSCCDGTALIVEAENTTRDEVLAARRDIEAMGGQVLGAVFNRARADTLPLPRRR